MNTEQLKFWTSSFGENYRQRNALTHSAQQEAANVFGTILAERQVGSILEVGCNIGINLAGIRQALGQDVEIMALEPNADALNQVSENGEIRASKLLNCTAFDIPLESGSVDLAFTNGVLIHIAPEDLLRATSEIVRVASKYVLCSEYFSTNAEMISYHGHENRLFKRDFGQFYLDNFSNLKVLDYGFLWRGEYEHYDDLTWWLFEKTD